MVFKHEKKDGTIEIPKYESFLDKECRYKSDSDMIKYLFGWSSSFHKVPNKTIVEIGQMIDREKLFNYDTMQLSCGHDKQN